MSCNLLSNPVILQMGNRGRQMVPFTPATLAQVTKLVIFPGSLTIKLLRLRDPSEIPVISIHKNNEIKIVKIKCAKAF